MLGLRPFDVQLIGGMILHEGQIAEMRTGEGKTLVSALPAFLNALSGKGVHVVTVNDYLARRDASGSARSTSSSASACGLIQAGMSEEERRDGYNSDVTYVTNSELGFDYLRDNLAQTPAELVLRDFNFCVIDEVDSILIDEARTPLIISGLADKPSERYVQAAKIADAFEKDFHYTVDEKQKSVLLTEEGYEAAEELLQVPDLYDPAHAVGAVHHQRHQGEGPAAQGRVVHRQGQGGGDRGRVHRPHDGRPPVVRRPAPGGRGQGGPPHSKRDDDHRQR